MNSDFDLGPHRRLFLAREAAKLKQEEAAELAGMTRQRLSRCENGKSSPTLNELRALCIAYGATPSYILMGADISAEIERAMKAASAGRVSADPRSA